MIQELSKTTILEKEIKVNLSDASRVFYIASKENISKKAINIKNGEVSKIIYQILIDSGKSKKIVVDTFTINFENGENTAFFARTDSLKEFYIKPIAIYTQVNNGQTYKLNKGEAAISLYVNAQ